MSRKADAVIELSKLTVRVLRALGNVGVAEREHACELAGQGWALLHEEHPEAAERMNGVLHYLTGPRFDKAEAEDNPEVSDRPEVLDEPSDAIEMVAPDDVEGAPAAPTAESEASTSPAAPTAANSDGHPWLPAPPSLDTEEAVAAYYKEVSDKAAVGDDFDMEVRHLIPADRHTLIIDAFNKLSPKQGFVLVNDHDPKPLYYQFAFEYADRFTWDPIEEGPEVWRVRIGRR